MVFFCSLAGLTHTPGRGCPDIVSVFNGGVCGGGDMVIVIIGHNLRSGGHPCHQILALAKAILHKQIFIQLSNLVL
jgi:hypothetical protein